MDFGYPENLSPNILMFYIIMKEYTRHSRQKVTSKKLATPRYVFCKMFWMHVMSTIFMSAIRRLYFLTCISCTLFMSACEALCKM
ncbi:unnamed protein product [Camellia sinensis]